MRWLDLTYSKAAVAGPWMGFVPELIEYRIAQIHIRDSFFWLYGCIANLPEHIPCDNERDGFRKYNLALQISVGDLISWRGRPMLDGKFDDSNHGFEVAKPVKLSISKLEETEMPPPMPLLIEAESKHLSFKMIAVSVGAYASRAATKRFTEAFYVRV